MSGHLRNLYNDFGWCWNCVCKVCVRGGGGGGGRV
jgi:hypothetical protein